MTTTSVRARGTTTVPARTSVELRIPTDHGELAATSTPGVDGSDSVVVLAHGFLSDRRAGGRYDRLAEEYASLGHAVLRFDFSGFGESDGDVVDGDALLADLHAVLDHVERLGHRRVLVHGHSLGSAVALRVAPRHESVRALVLTGALTGAGSGDTPYPFLTPEQVQDWYLDRDVHLPVRADAVGVRTHVTVSRRRPKVGSCGTQEAVLSAVRVPVLVVHGEQGSEQRLAATTAQGAHWLPEHSRVEVVPGADHTFLAHQGEVAALAREWAARWLPSVSHPGPARAGADAGAGRSTNVT